MLPIRHFSDLHRFLDNDYGLIKAPFYIMALYKSEHKEFREFIISRFIDIHHYTQDIAFIVCDTPPEGWNERDDAQYYEKLVGKEYKPVLDDYEINIIAKYMDISINALPCLVFFDDLSKETFNCFSFAGENINVKETFFSSLLEKTALFSSGNKRYLDIVIELGREFRNVKKFIDWEIDYVVKRRLSNASEDLVFYKSEQGKATPDKRPRKLTPLQHTKECFQARAQQIWQRDQNIPISEMINRDRLLLCFDEYKTAKVQEQTLHRWIDEFAPPLMRKPGRRPNK